MFDDDNSGALEFGASFVRARLLFLLRSPRRRWLPFVVARKATTRRRCVAVLGRVRAPSARRAVLTHAAPSCCCAQLSSSTSRATRSRTRRCCAGCTTSGRRRPTRRRTARRARPRTAAWAPPRPVRRPSAPTRPSPPRAATANRCVFVLCCVVLCCVVLCVGVPRAVIQDTTVSATTVRRRLALRAVATARASRRETRGVSAAPPALPRRRRRVTGGGAREEGALPCGADHHPRHRGQRHARRERRARGRGRVHGKVPQLRARPPRLHQEGRSQHTHTLSSISRATPPPAVERDGDARGFVFACAGLGRVGSRGVSFAARGLGLPTARPLLTRADTRATDGDRCAARADARHVRSSRSTSSRSCRTRRST